MTSPLHVYGSAIPGADGVVYVDLIGEFGEYLSRQALRYGTGLGTPVLIQPEIEFSLTGASELARLVVYSLDTANRIIGLTSQDLILLKVGEDQIYTPWTQLEPFEVTLPKPNQDVYGGFVNVIGMACGVNANPLIFELIDEQGRVVGSTEILIDQPIPGYSHAAMNVMVPYQVNERTPVRLTLRQESAGRIPGTVTLWSVPVNVFP